MKEKITHIEEEQDLFEHYNIKVDSGQDLIRIDKYLMDRLPNTSRNRIQDAASAGSILVNNRASKSSYKVKPNDEISIVLPYPVQEYELLPENIPLNIIFEDDTVIVLKKPAGLVVHPGSGNFTGTLVNGLLFHFSALPQKNDGFTGRPGLVHRLDKDTTGIMVIAKTDKALTHLSKQFFDRSIERTYYALVWGDVENNEGVISGNIGRSLKNRKIMSVFPNGEYGKHSVTHYKVLKRFGYVTLVQCKLKTGRTHQIRVHFRYIKHPLFNDVTYGGDKILKGTTFTKYKQFVQNCFSTIPRQALHAKTLGFIHPKTGKKMQFESELPEDFQNVLNKWENYVTYVKE